MARKRVSINMDDCIKRYLSGEGLKPLAKSFGIGETTLRRRFVELGIPLRGPKEAHPFKPLPISDEEIFDRYQSGETKKDIARSLGVHDATIQRRLEQFGVEVAKNYSEAMKTRWKRLDQAGRYALVEAAHEATRGKKHSFNQLCRRALGVQHHCPNVSEAEKTVAKWLAGQGISIIPQQAVGPYNADLGAFPVAVEVFGGHWHASGRHAARMPKRTRYFFNEGWNVYIIWVNALHHPLLPQVTDDLVAFVQKSRSNPSFRGQYRVVWGNGQFISAGCSNDNDLSLVPSAERHDWARSSD